MRSIELHSSRMCPFEWTVWRYLFYLNFSFKHVSKVNYIQDPTLRLFYEFGPEAHDTVFLKDDDHHYLIQKGIDFKFFGSFYSAFFLSTNGVCELVANEDEKFKVSENPKDFPIFKHAIIAPFWADIATEIYGDVYHRLENDVRFNWKNFVCW